MGEVGCEVRSQSTSVPPTHQKITKSCKLANFRFQKCRTLCKISFSFSFLEFHFQFCQGTFRIFILILSRNFIFNCYNISFWNFILNVELYLAKHYRKWYYIAIEKRKGKTSSIQESTECTWTTEVKVCYNIATQGRERNFYHGPHSS